VVAGASSATGADTLGRGAAEARAWALADSAAADSISARVQSGAADDSLSSAASGRPPGYPPVDSTASRSRPEARKPSTFDQPRWVMLRSLVVPGWGQYHNRAYWKAGAVAGVEGYLIARILGDESKLRRLQDDVDAALAAGDNDAYQQAVAAYNSVLDASVSRWWLLGGVVAYAMLDAYVDAHFVDFDIQFKDDPALKGRPPGARVTLGLRWRF